MPAPTPPRIPGLIDAHCHLDMEPMADDVPGTLAAAAAAGVEQIVHIGCSLQSHDRARALAAAHPQVFAVIGVHPHEASTVDDVAMQRVAEHAASDDVVAIGETGLDYYYDRSPRQAQQEAMARHLELARTLDMPVVLHIRDAHDDAIEVVRRHPPRTTAPGMVHCFTGGPDEARRWLDLGFHLSFSGIATFKTAEPIREAAVLCPPGRILLETDAPFLAPVPARGRPGSPALVAFTCIRVAQARAQSPQMLAEAATANTRALLGLPDPP